jgi:hypothetical protein
MEVVLKNKFVQRAVLIFPFPRLLHPYLPPCLDGGNFED